MLRAKQSLASSRTSGGGAAKTQATPTGSRASNGSPTSWPDPSTFAGVLASRRFANASGATIRLPLVEPTPAPPPRPMNSLASAIIFITLLLAMLHLLYANIQSEAPMRRVATGSISPMQDQQLADDQRFVDIAAGGNLAIHFEPFDT